MQPPNIIVIQTDDQDLASMRPQVMPNVFRDVGSKGTTFTDYIDSGPLCCPSRAVLLTGQYGHNNGVTWNNPNPYGELRGKNNTLPVWLQQAGYVTAHLGKYLNLYDRATGDPNQVPPGWDEWHTLLEPLAYYGYTLHENGGAVSYGSRENDYLTRVLNYKAVGLIHRYVPRRPLFMVVDQFAPHNAPSRDPRCGGTALPDPRDEGLFLNAPLPSDPSFNERSVIDKPSFIRAQPQLSASDIADLKRENGCRLASLRAVDRGVGRIFDALRSEHALWNTAVFYTTDNGYMLGAHRVVGKIDPYEEDLHVPLMVRLPRRFLGSDGAPQTLTSTVANVDLAPTIVDLAGAVPCNPAGACRVLDGRSMLNAIRSDGENWPLDRAILLELQAYFPYRAAPYTPCDYEGISTADEVYVQYHSSTLDEAGQCQPREETEHYELSSDPFELQNLFPASSSSTTTATEASPATRLDELRDCAGIEDRDPEPASGHYCQ